MSLPLASIFTDIPEWVVVFFHDTVGLGWGPAIVALTFTVRLLILPLSLKQIRSMRAMAELQPHIKAIQQKHKNDKQRQQQEMMRFYQENEINPLASCLPLVLQIPVFISLYYMLKGDSFQEDVLASPPEGWLFINSLLQPPEGATMVVPALRDDELDMPLGPWVDPENFNPGYLTRSMHLMPKQGAAEPWRLEHDYTRERDVLPVADLDDCSLEYS